MKKVETVNSFDKIKLLADSRRMDILRLLMASPATLTHLARTMKRSPAWIRHHMLTLESADLIEVSEIRKTGKVTEKFYRAKADASPAEPSKTYFSLAAINATSEGLAMASR